VLHSSHSIVPENYRNVTARTKVRICCKRNGVWVVSFVVFLISRIPFAATASPQDRPVLRITEPAEGAIVNPGQTVTVRVSSPTPALFPGVLVGGDVIGFAGTISPLPGELSVPIPEKIKLGRHRISVSGRPRSGKDLIFAATEVDVERPDLPASISAQFPGLQFDSAGEQSRLNVYAEFFDRTTSPVTTVTYTVTESSHISFSSANTEVATVDSSGQVTAVAPGIGEIRVKYTLGDNRVSIGIPMQVRDPNEQGSKNKFVFSIAPGLQKIEPGGSASFNVTVSSFANFPGEIEFSAHGLPDGATARFTPVSAHAPSSVTLTISTSQSTSLDSYQIYITARSGEFHSEVGVLLVVTANSQN
jgi:Big-like domain-containing protein